MSHLLYSRVTEDKSEIVLEAKDGTELGRYTDADALHKAVAKDYGAAIIIPREEQLRA